jgi:hypothetical protein
MGSSAGGALCDKQDACRDPKHAPFDGLNINSSALTPGGLLYFERPSLVRQNEHDDIPSLHSRQLSS